jgi:hypothetical protein
LRELFLPHWNEAKPAKFTTRWTIVPSTSQIFSNGSVTNSAILVVPALAPKLAPSVIGPSPTNALLIEN